MLHVLQALKVFWFYKLLSHVADDCHLALEERLATQGHRYEECGRKQIADNLLLELWLETAMAIATCIAYVFPNSLRQTPWTCMKRWFCLRLGESIRKHLSSLRLPPPPQDNVANVSNRWGVDEWNFLASRHANIVLGGSGGLDGSKIRQSVS